MMLSIRVSRFPRIRRGHASRTRRHALYAPASRSRGFTLLEVLVSLLIFALIASATVAVMAYAADNQGVVRSHMDRLGEFQAARSLLQADLSQATSRRTRHADGSAARDAFVAGRVGEPGLLLAFVHRGWENPEGEPRASLQYVEYRLVDARLERTARTALDGPAADTPQVLLDGVRSASLAFHDRGAWSDGWIGGAQILPDAVELTLKLDGIGTVRQRFLLPRSRS